MSLSHTHAKGIWRKTTLASYKSGAPVWKTVIDVDALPPPTTDTAKTWVWHGSTLLDDGPGTEVDRCIIALSPGGSDADTRREFDLVAEKWVEAADGGFAMPTAAKTQLCWRSRNEVLVGTDFGADGKTLTDSGYPRVVKSWKRGTPIEDAKVVFEGLQSDVAASQYAYHDRGFVHEFQLRSITFYTSKFFYRALSVEGIRGVTADAETTPFAEVKIPEDAEMGTFASAAMVTLRSDWQPPGSGRVFEAGALISAPMESVMKEDWSQVTALFEPSASRSLRERTETKEYVVLNVLEDVRATLEFWKFDDGRWVKQEAAGGEAVKVGEDVSVENLARQSDSDNLLWLTREGYLVPDSQEMADAADGCTVTEKIRSKPAMFDAAGLCVEQFFAASLDGTRVPYFVMRRSDIPLDGSTPTLVDAYGGEIRVRMLAGGDGGRHWCSVGA
jgi:prolyl oligopeptidase